MMTEPRTLALWVMWAISVAVVVLPFILMIVFNGANETDGRGRRISRRWHS
jgi:hypothetical protein